MRLFTEARDAKLHCDAYLVDTRRRGRPLVLEPAVGRDHVIGALLDRVVLMGRSVYAVRDRTFALFCGGGRELVLAATEPFHEDVMAVLRDALREFGAVREEPDVPLDGSGLFPLVAYEKGRVSFFDSCETRAWVPLAGRRGLRILGATCAHAAAAHVLVGDVPAPDYVEEIVP